jgi:ADP-ribose pyrophosphatase YjhB (NUDIX family)
VGAWEFPGGTVKYGELLRDSIVRELQEEYGIRIELYSLLGVFDHLLPDEGQHWVSVTYLTRRVEGVAEIREPDKCAAIGWFEFDALPTPLSKITAKNVQAFRSRRALRRKFQQWAQRETQRLGDETWDFGR